MRFAEGGRGWLWIKHAILRVEKKDPLVGMKEALCQAFCGSLNSHGRALDTRQYAFARMAIRRLSTSGRMIRTAQASTPRGRRERLSLSSKRPAVEFDEARSESVCGLLKSHKSNREDEMMLHTQPLREHDVSRQMRFALVSLMLRVNDFVADSRDKVTSTFKEDAPQ